ncbi:unnamed protein product [Paramecium sonneborni]|uniref:Uncharacterized protein n=1 Tax=Paramecium sonneborni TaxID=65129 RepID=A0A8S1N9X8_9CILI|nr:unnamed protein product [Paramecium sonneborni]
MSFKLFPLYIKILSIKNLVIIYSISLLIQNHSQQKF